MKGLGWKVRCCRVLVAVGALVLMVGVAFPLFLVALAVGALVLGGWWAWRAMVRRRRPAWDPEGGSPELPWPPREPDHVRLKREAYGRRRQQSPWARASAREFAEARAGRKAATHG